MYAASSMHVAFLLALSLAPAARPLAIMPVTGVSASIADAADLAVIDDAIRNATIRDDVALQSKDVTTSAVAAARKAGVEGGGGGDPRPQKIAAPDEAGPGLV